MIMMGELTPKSESRYDVLPIEELRGRLLTLSRWHRDVKPANILVCGVVKDGDWDIEFLLSDLGLTRFQSLESQHLSSLERVDRGIHTYGALGDVLVIITYQRLTFRAGSPEQNLHASSVHNYSKSKKQKLDVWALACVYSEFATWIAAGMKGLCKYRERRKEETDLAGHPVFHDSQGDALSFLSTHHNQLSEVECSKQDGVTPLIWTHLLHEMFVKLNIRPTAAQVTWKAENQVLNLAKEVLQQKPSMLLARTSSKKAPIRVMTAPTRTMEEPDQSPPRTPEDVPPGYQRSSQATEHPSQDSWSSPFSHSNKRSDATVHTDPSSPNSPTPAEPSSFVQAPMLASPPAMTAAEGFGVHGINRMSPPPLDLHNGTADLAHRFSNQSTNHYGIFGNTFYTQYQPLAAPTSDHRNGGRIERQRQSIHQDLSGNPRHGSVESGIYYGSTSPQPAATVEAPQESSQDSLVTEAQVTHARSPKPKKELSVEELHEWAKSTHEHAGWPKLLRKEHFLKHEKELVDQLRKRDHVS